MNPHAKSNSFLSKCRFNVGLFKALTPLFQNPDQPLSSGHPCQAMASPSAMLEGMVNELGLFCWPLRMTAQEFERLTLNDTRKAANGPGLPGGVHRALNR